VGGTSPPELIEEYRARLGLNKPLLTQYFEYLSKIVHGDFGESTRTGKKVLEDILLRFPATLELAIFGMLVAILIGLWTGTYAAIHSDRPADHAIRIFNIGSFAIPVFWIGLVLQTGLRCLAQVVPRGRANGPLRSPPPSSRSRGSTSSTA
jgi:peptide/nickel transport system permease protein